MLAFLTTTEKMSLHHILLILLIFFTGSSTSHHDKNSTSIHIALLLPENLSPEIVHGAVTAVEMINKDESLLANKTLKLHYPRNWIAIPEVESIGRYNITALIGLFQLSEVQVHYPLAVASRLNIPLLLSGSPHPRVFNTDKYPDLFHLVQAATNFVRATFQFLERLGWNQISIITDELDFQNFDTAKQARLISKDYNLATAFYSVTTQSDIKYILNSLNLYGSRMTLVAMSSSNTLDLLCEAHLKGQVWPTRIWIVAYHPVEDIVSNPTRKCVAGEIVEGVIFVHRQLFAEESTALVSGLTYQQLVHEIYNSTVESPLNPYKNMLHDAVWATALTVNASMKESEYNTTLNVTTNGGLQDALSKLSFCGASGLVQFSQKVRADSKMATYQIINGTKRPLEDDLFSLEADLFPSLRSPVLFIILLFLTIITSFIFVTVTLVLYCFYRKRDVIKATSFSLSMMIFIGCYLILLYLMFLDMGFLPEDQKLSSASFRKITCLTLIWTNGLGIPSTLIFATLLVKMVRVYRIFSIPKKLKFSSNTALLFYIMLLMIPNVIFLMVWTIDMAYVNDTSYYSYSADTQNGTLNSSKSYDLDGLAECVPSSTTFLFLLLLSSYFIILMFSLVIVAILTRKIRYRNFKDSKKVNILVILLFLTYVSSLPYWMISQALDIGDSESRRVVLHVAHILIVVECIGLLFVPKIYPLLKEAIATKRVSMKSITTAQN